MTERKVWETCEKCGLGILPGHPEYWCPGCDEFADDLGVLLQAYRESWHQYTLCNLMRGTPEDLKWKKTFEFVHNKLMARLQPAPNEREP